MPFSPEENMLEVQRSLGRIEGAVQALDKKLEVSVAALDRKLEDHVLDEAAYREGLERRALAKGSNRATLIAGILGSGALVWFINWLTSAPHK